MVINQKFFINGFKGLLHGSPNMDTLVAMGSMAVSYTHLDVYKRQAIKQLSFIGLIRAKARCLQIRIHV